MNWLVMVCLFGIELLASPSLAAGQSVSRDAPTVSPVVGSAGCIVDKDLLGSQDDPPPELRRCARSGGRGGALLGQVFDVAVTADGRDVYVQTQHGIGLLRRDLRTGRLTENGCVEAVLQSRPGCLVPAGLRGEADHGDSPETFALSPDGQYLYSGWRRGYFAELPGAIVLLARDGMTGKVRDVGCVSNDGSSGRCSAGLALDGPVSVIGVSSDGLRLWAFGRLGRTQAVLVFARDLATGQLTAIGCGVASAQPGQCTRLASPVQGPAVVLPSGRGIIGGSSAITTIDIDANAVMRRSRCWNPRGTRGCRRLSGIDGIEDLVLSSDGRYLYVPSIAGQADQHTLSWFAVGDDGSELVRLGCVSSSGRAPCRRGHGILTNGASVELAGDEAFLVGSGPDGRGGNIAIFDRDAASGELRQSGCISSRPTHGCMRVPELRSELGSAGASADGRNIYLPVPFDGGHLVVLGRGTGIAGDASWQLRRGVIRLVLSCPRARAEGCRGTVRVTDRSGASRRLGSTPYTLGAGTTERVTVHVRRSVQTRRSLLSRTIEVVATDAAGVVRASRRTVRIHPTA